MDRHEATGAAATASMLRELADEIDEGVIRMGDGQLRLFDGGVSAAVNGAGITDGRVSVTLQLEGRRSEHQASDLERELAHPGD